MSFKTPTTKSDWPRSVETTGMVGYTLVNTICLLALEKIMGLDGDEVDVEDDDDRANADEDEDGDDSEDEEERDGEDQSDRQDRSDESRSDRDGSSGGVGTSKDLQMV